MDKDLELKHLPQYSYEALRSRISRLTKQVRDDGEEMSQRRGKISPIIPVTGSGRPHKYSSNKSPRSY